MKVNKEVNIQKLRKEAEDKFGSLYCSEAIIASINDNFGLNLPEEALAMASAFPVGLGGAGCVCGAVSGGAMALGLMFGRTKPNDPKVAKTMELSRELHDYFKKENGKHTLCCRMLIKEFEDKGVSHADQCRRFTGMIAEKTAEIIAREMDIKNIDE